MAASAFRALFVSDNMTNASRNFINKVWAGLRCSISIFIFIFRSSLTVAETSEFSFSVHVIIAA